MKPTAWECSQDPDALLGWIHDRMGGAKHVTGVQRSTPDTLDVTAAAIPSLAVVFAILLFPIGLLLLLVRSQRVLHFRATPGPDGKGSRLYISGALVGGTQTALTAIYNDLAASGSVAVVTS